ncbi:hypothetical protein [Modestobacter sp. VKM Ac-2983]|uniref:hypothetical protein n=1 Tax=Modestobacter sp. VKM Ac-2983 TaxID=3004137 RepID=UPI003FA5749A
MGGIADQGHAGDPLPPVAVRQLMDAAQDRGGVGIGDEGDEGGCPVVELGGDDRLRGVGVGEVDAGEPLQRAVEDDVGVDAVARLAMGEEPVDGLPGT